MAGVTQLRDAARAAMLDGGGRGFVRFCAEGDALLVCDALRRCADDAAAGRLIAAMEAAGFACASQDGLLYLTPGDALLLALCAGQPDTLALDWTRENYAARALGARLLREAPMLLDDGGQRLLIETARLLWQPEDRVAAGLPALRARVAVRLREGKRSGLHETGRLLAGWLQTQ